MNVPYYSAQKTISNYFLTLTLADSLNGDHQRLICYIFDLFFVLCDHSELSFNERSFRRKNKFITFRPGIPGSSEIGFLESCLKKLCEKSTYEQSLNRRV